VEEQSFGESLYLAMCPTLEFIALEIEERSDEPAMVANALRSHHLVCDVRRGRSQDQLLRVLESDAVAGGELRRSAREPRSRLSRVTKAAGLSADRRRRLLGRLLDGDGWWLLRHY
jgi:hypothetical protein